MVTMHILIKSYYGNYAHIDQHTDCIIHYIVDF